jgi:hypothetical protein
MASGVYTAVLSLNCARSMKAKMMVSSSLISVLRMFASDSAELMSRACDASEGACDGPTDGGEGLKRPASKQSARLPPGPLHAAARAAGQHAALVRKATSSLQTPGAAAAASCCHAQEEQG